MERRLGDCQVRITHYCYFFFQLLTCSTRSSSSNNPIVQTYVLPDFVPTSTNKLGYLRPPSSGETPRVEEDIEMDLTASDAKGKGREATSAPITSVVAVEEEEQLLQMSNERFTVPEVLFNPSTIGSSFFLTGS